MVCVDGIQELGEMVSVVDPANGWSGSITFETLLTDYDGGPWSDTFLTEP
jgi:hypothetical protein